jgi:hypothetical protein
VYNPGETTANFTAQIFGANDKTFGTVIHDSVPANSVKDFPITGLADGDYAAFISSNQSIAAAVRLARSDKTKKPNTDFTWLQAAQALTGSQQITVPNSGISKLSLTNSGSALATVMVNGSTISLKPQTVAVIPAKGGPLTLSVSSGSVGGNLLVDVSGSIANLAVVDYRNSGSRVSVLVR